MYVTNNLGLSCMCIHALCTHIKDVQRKEFKTYKVDSTHYMSTTCEFLRISRVFFEHPVHVRRCVTHVTLNTRVFSDDILGEISSVGIVDNSSRGV